MADAAPTSTASVATDRPQRYGKQLVSHLTRRATGAWDEATRSGFIDFGQGRADLTATAHSLDLQLTCAPEDSDRLEDVLGRHLVRFAAKDELAVAWVRADGSAGTRQRNDGD